MTTYKMPQFHLQSNHALFKLRTAIITADCDSCQLFLDTFGELANSYLDIVGTASDKNQAIQCIENKKPDLVFLDLEMGAAFDILDNYKNPPFKIILTSQDDKNALKAFKYGAIDYIIKPIDSQEILNSIDRVRKTQFDQAIYNRLDYLLKQNHFGSNFKITIPTSEGINLLSISDIIRIEADRSYCYIYLTDGDRILVSKPLKEMENLLPENLFFRIHSAYLINLDYVKRYSKVDGGNVVLNDGSHVPIARRRKKEFLQRINS